MSTASLQFGFLLLVALGNLSLGFALARRLGWGAAILLAVQSYGFQWQARATSRRTPDADEDPDESISSGQPSVTGPIAAAVPPGAPDVADVSESEPGIATPSIRDGEKVRRVLEESRKTLVDIVAGLLQAGEALTPLELEAAALKTNDVGQHLQRQLNLAADQFRQLELETDAGGSYADTADMLERLWETINEALVDLMVHSFDQESLGEPIQKLTDTIQAIANASQDVVSKLEQTLAESHAGLPA